MRTQGNNFLFFFLNFDTVLQNSTAIKFGVVFLREIVENAAQRLPPTTIKNLYPVGGIQVRREDEQAALTGLRTPVWSTRHIIPVGLTVVLDVALVQDQTAPLGATK